MHWGNAQFGSVMLNLFVAPLAIWGMLTGTYSYFWNSVEGHVIKSERITTSKGSASRIEFAYTIENVTYISDRVKTRPRISSGMRHYDAKYYNMYEVGEPVIVYYPSIYPSFGILIKGVTLQSILVFMFSLFLIYLECNHYPIAIQ